MKTSTERMIAEKDGTIGWMTFNNPARHNAVSMDMWQAVPEILAEFERDPNIHVIVLGCGRQGVRIGRGYFRVRRKTILARTDRQIQRDLGQGQ